MNFQVAAARLIAILIFSMALPSTALANNDVQTAWRLLDYIAVDYAVAVQNGAIINEVEYAEMTEFSAMVAERMAKLEPDKQRTALIARTDALIKMIAAKEAPEIVARDARILAAELLAAYPVPLAPKAAPDLSRGAALYAQNCASCHGKSGGGDGSAAVGLDPAPTAFDDKARARQRSIFALYQVVEQGLDGTAMQSFIDLPAKDRWNLALYTGTIAFSDIDAGRQIWESDASIRNRFSNLADLTSVTPAALGQEIGMLKADAVMAFLRAHPETVVAGTPGSLSFARERLHDSLAAYEAGRVKEARDLALSAYLDGFEPLETVLNMRDAGLMASIESAMAELRFAIGEGQSSATVSQKVAALDKLFADAENALAQDDVSDVSIVVGAFAILLREGLEALLIVIAMIAFLRKAERTDAISYVHGGWIAALLAGGVTWIAATFVIDISGASRELMEGFGSLFAAIVLLSVGIWMHGKSQAGEWQRYIQKTMDKALSRSSAWFLFGLAFIVVYREVFETILFFAALWVQGNGQLILAGTGAAIVLLALIAWVMLRYSRDLPFGTFFAYSSILIGILAVVLVGKGVASLQEAGLIDITPLPSIPRLPIIGLYPAFQTVVAQFFVLWLIGLGFWFNRRKNERLAS
ncbi:FTR1 family protein [Parasphingorhabdus sp.]|uniref:FTR1 family protein n=1 Tax=Parasphingorhabdus sp. TaxID=2709688 RepID=UPI002F9376F0